MAMVTGLLFLIDWWFWEISFGSGIPIEILGTIFGGIMLTLHFMNHVITVKITIMILAY